MDWLMLALVAIILAGVFLCAAISMDLVVPFAILCMIGAVALAFHQYFKIRSLWEEADQVPGIKKQLADEQQNRIGLERCLKAEAVKRKKTEEGEQRTEQLLESERQARNDAESTLHAIQGQFEEERAGRIATEASLWDLRTELREQEKRLKAVQRSLEQEAVAAAEAKRRHKEDVNSLKEFDRKAQELAAKEIEAERRKHEISERQESRLREQIQVFTTELIGMKESLSTLNKDRELAEQHLELEGTRIRRLEELLQLRCCRFDGQSNSLIRLSEAFEV